MVLYFEEYFLSITQLAGAKRMQRLDIGQKDHFWMDPLEIAGAIPAMRTQPLFGKADGCHQIIESLIHKRREPQIHTNPVDHFQVSFRACPCIVLQEFIAIVFDIVYDLSAGQIQRRS